MMIKKVVFRILFGSPIEKLYYSAISCWDKGGVYKLYSLYLTKRIQSKFGCYLSPKAKVGKGLTLKHPTGIVIGDGVKIGENVTIYQSVTLGAARKGEGALGLYPQIGSGCVVYAGAVVIGSVNIEENSTVAANAVVIDSCKPNSILVGIPAKIINRQSG